MRDAAQEAKEERKCKRVGAFIRALREGAGVRSLPEGVLTSVKVRFPTEEEPSTLLVVRASSGEGPRIAFIGAYDVGDALLAWMKRDEGQRMRWRKDLPWEQRGERMGV